MYILKLDVITYYCELKCIDLPRITGSTNVCCTTMLCALWSLSVYYKSTTFV